MNMVGAGKAGLHLEVQYPPSVMIIHDNFTINKELRILECKPDGFPNVYHFDRWEHKSFFGDHIRYLNANNGILILPNVKSKIERYQDSGVYLCAVNNGIPDQNGDINQQGQTSVSVKGLPVFVESNEPFQKGKMDNFAFLTVHIISNPKYDDVFCSTSNWKLSLKNNPNIFNEEESIIRDIFHNNEILVHGFTVTFKTVRMKKNNFHNYTVTAVNKYGSASYNICLVENVKKQEQLTDIQGPVIFLISAGAILSSIIVNLCIMVLYRRCKRRRSIQSSNEVQFHYDEINESEQVNISHMLQNQRSNIQEPPSVNIIRSFSSNFSSSSSSKSEHVYLDPYTSFIQSENYITLGIMKMQTPCTIRDKINPFFSLTCVAAENKFKCTQKGNWKSSRQYRSAEF
ncbi:uncharacterized protein LOC127717633 [Mytilus californianus]|uniref:uncharacterized protein LOC127717633 n=1 Tax=Mytilus californianus TaxID=6549 RepID=UPI002245EC41|nr:uncharacterized protein LOC127717633 [Mytilus californianus]